MAPEQLEGKTRDARTDIFAFGARALRDGDRQEGVYGTRPGLAHLVDHERGAVADLDALADEPAGARPRRADLSRQGSRRPLADRARRRAPASGDPGRPVGVAARRSARSGAPAADRAAAVAPRRREPGARRFRMDASSTARSRPSRAAHLSSAAAQRQLPRPRRERRGHGTLSRRSPTRVRRARDGRHAPAVGPGHGRARAVRRAGGRGGHLSLLVAGWPIDRFLRPGEAQSGRGVSQSASGARARGRARGARRELGSGRDHRLLAAELSWALARSRGRGHAGAGDRARQDSRRDVAPVARFPAGRPALPLHGPIGRPQGADRGSQRDHGGLARRGEGARGDPGVHRGNSDDLCASGVSAVPAGGQPDGPPVRSPDAHELGGAPARGEGHPGILRDGPGGLRRIRRLARLLDARLGSPDASVPGRSLGQGAFDAHVRGIADPACPGERWPDCRGRESRGASPSRPLALRDRRRPGNPPHPRLDSAGCPRLSTRREASLLLVAVERSLGHLGDAAARREGSQAVSGVGDHEDVLRHLARRPLAPRTGSSTRERAAI